MQDLNFQPYAQIKPVREDYQKLIEQTHQLIRQTLMRVEDTQSTNQEIFSFYLHCQAWQEEAKNKKPSNLEGFYNC